MPLYPRLYAVASAILGDVSQEAADAVEAKAQEVLK